MIKGASELLQKLLLLILLAPAPDFLLLMLLCWNTVFQSTCTHLRYGFVMIKRGKERAVIALLSIHTPSHDNRLSTVQVAIASPTHRILNAPGTHIVYLKCQPIVKSLLTSRFLASHRKGRRALGAAGVLPIWCGIHPP